jgi:hypothetical protein
MDLVSHQPPLVPHSSASFIAIVESGRTRLRKRVTPSSYPLGESRLLQPQLGKVFGRCGKGPMAQLVELHGGSGRGGPASLTWWWWWWWLVDSMKSS